ncbi:MAG: hypothetical protein U0414_33670 [Polyangiaceae bacterium]
MSVPIPVSPALMLLWLALPGVWLAGRAIAREISRDRAVLAVLPIGLALALLVFAVHVASLLAGSLLVGLPVGTILVAAAGLAAELSARRRGRRVELEGEAPSRGMWMSAIASLALVVPMALRFHFHDEVLLTGHMSIASELENGVYPPRHLSFADFPLRYHYGFDVVSASIGMLTRLPVDRAIDAATIGLWALSWCLAWTLGERLVGRSRAWLVPLVMLFGGGYPFGCTRSSDLLAVCGARQDPSHLHVDFNAPFVSYFFQHPWSLGTPIALVALLLWSARRADEPLRAGAPRLAALAAVLAILSMSQIVLFFALAPTLVVAESRAQGRWTLRRGAAMLVVSVAAVAVAYGLGGFFARAPGLPNLPMSLHGGILDTVRGSIAWNANAFAVLLPLGIWGLFALRDGQWLVLPLAAGALVVLNSVRYALSTDIVKFAALAILALGIPASARIGRLLPPWPWSGAWAWARGLLAIALLVACVLESLIFAVAVAVRQHDFTSMLRAGPELFDEDDARVVSLLRARARAGDVVYRARPASLGYAQWGGLPQLNIDWGTVAFGFPKERIEARRALATRPPSDPAAWRAEGVRWFVLDDSPEDAPLRAHCDAWIASGIAEETAQVGHLHVVELR